MKLDKFTVGKRYGRALFELAVEEQQSETVYQELVSLRNVFQEIPDLGNILSDVRLDLTSKRTIMEQILQEYNGIVKNFLEVVYRYNRMDDLILIIDEYERRYNEAKNVISGTITTAVKLTEKQKAQVAVKIAQRLGYEKAELTERVDPEIIGGVIVEANHQVIDGSIRNRLEGLRTQLRKQ
ncbi:MULTISPECIES: F0F1 ATP synthase subunit delta [Enterococcus]|uniref:F0F1 ATP synthase subunit delta n=1 Tax=Enterococcus TaxID=1350 RepID=UPI00065DFB1D|nr:MULTISPECIES: F0F1 ATP synthase subunit delta [Enterococcus]KAF1301239.1 ATP synthase F1 subunit delta [Enterococcus sp. JM9B]